MLCARETSCFVFTASFLQHWYAKTIYTDISASCGSGSLCYVTNDSPKSFSGKVEISSVEFASGASTQLLSKNLSMAAGMGVKEFFSLPTEKFTNGAIDGTIEILHVVVTSADGTAVNENWIPFATPGTMKLPAASVTFTVADTAEPDGSVKVTVTSDKFALYVTLTTLAQGRFSDNAFCMTPGSQTVSFIPILGFDMSELKSSLRVEHAATYI